MTNTFLPKGYKTPEAQTNYLRPIEGKIKFRAIGEAITGFEYWTDKKKPVRSLEEPKEKPEDIKLEKDGSYSIKHFWAFPVIDRNDLGGVIKVMQINQYSIQKDLENYLLNSDWGDITGYDITITGTGQGFDRRYSTIASPHTELTEKEKDLIKKTYVNTRALLYGEDPFDTKWKEPAKIVEDVETPF